MKKFLLLPGFLLGLISFAHAQQAVSLESSAVAIESVAAAKDTLKTASVANTSLAAKKKGFKDLFDNDNLATAGPRLTQGPSVLYRIILKKTAKTWKTCVAGASLILM